MLELMEHMPRCSAPVLVVWLQLEQAVILKLLVCLAKAEVLLIIRVEVLQVVRPYAYCLCPNRNLQDGRQPSETSLKQPLRKGFYEQMISKQSSPTFPSLELTAALALLLFLTLVGASLLGAIGVMFC